MINRKPLELPPEVARAFLATCVACFAEKDRHKRDQIAVYQLRTLQGFQGPLEKKLQLSDVRELFDRIRSKMRLSAALHEAGIFIRFTQTGADLFA